MPSDKRVKDPDNPSSATAAPLKITSPPKTADPVLEVPLAPSVPLTKKKVSVPISLASSGVVGVFCAPLNMIEPVVLIFPAAGEEKKFVPAPSRVDIVTCPVEDVVIVIVPADAKNEVPFERRVSDPENPDSEVVVPLTVTSPPKRAEPVFAVPFDPMVPLTKKNTSLPLSEGASIADGDVRPPIKAAAPVVKIDPTVVLLKKSSASDADPAVV